MMGYCGFAGELQYKVVNPQGATIFDRDGSTPLSGKAVPAGTVIMGTPRGDGYTVEVASQGYLGWVHALDLQQLTSAPPSPLLRTGADPTTLPPELAAALKYYQSLSQTPVTIRTGLDGQPTIVPVLPCPSGQHWGTTACVPDIPLPPPESPMPPTLDAWRRQQHPGSTHTGWNLFEDVFNWRDPFKGNRQGQRDLKRDQWRGRHQDQPFAQQDMGNGGFDQGQGGFDRGQGGFDPHHPHHHHDEHRHHEEHARQHFVGAAATQAATAQAHAQAAQTAASQPAGMVSNTAKKHAAAATNHAALATHHTTLASAHPTAHGAAEHARLATSHTQAAAAHAEGAHAALRGDHARSREIGHSVDRAFGFRGGRPEGGRGREGFFGRGGRGYGWGGRRWGGGWGHPAWLREIDPRWFHHHAECWRQGPYGCYVEQIFGPGGQVCYRVTPAGEQEGIELEVEEQQANDQYQQDTGEAAPTADDGKLPGSDQSGDGSQAPAADTAGDATADTGNAADAGDAAADTATGWYMSFSDPWGNYDYSAPGAWDSHYGYPGLGLSSTHNPYYSYPYADDGYYGYYGYGF